MMRAREARSSSVRAASISCRSSASSAARRSVMSNIAPSIHSRPPGPRTSWPRSSTQRIVAVGAHDPVLEPERLVRPSAASTTASSTCVAVVGVHDAEQIVRCVLARKFAGG